MNRTNSFTFLVFSIVLGVVRGEYNWSDLTSMLSENAVLHGPFQNVADTYQPCENLGTDSYQISQRNQGICMHAHSCSHQFCIRSNSKLALPSYVIEAKVDNDVASALKFASENNITASVKTTGHSYQGSSTQANTLMIWMQNFEKDLTIKPVYNNSCGDNHAVIAVAGGAVWNDVIESVKSDYHVVTGGGRTVSVIGGWLQGGGLSFTSRKYGLGVDQVVDLTVVLPNGTTVTASRCENSDLFWALRGGGGGTFGVVVQAHYKLYPSTRITKLNYFFGVKDEQTYREYWSGKGGIEETIASFFAFWIEKSPHIDPNWCGGFFGLTISELLYCGPVEEAIASTFYEEITAWYDNLDKSRMVAEVWGSVLLPIEEYESWYDYKGGAEAYGNPDFTDQTGTAYDGVNEMSSRLMPTSELVNRPSEILDLLMSFDVLFQIGLVNYFLGGNINDVPIEESAMHPSARSAAWTLTTFDAISARMVRDLIPNNLTGVGYNHHNAWEPDWRNACWGSHYNRLSELKEKFDPDHVLNCWHCVGYRGDEYDSTISDADRPSVEDNSQPSSAPFDRSSPENLVPTSSAPTDSPSPKVSSGESSSGSASFLSFLLMGIVLIVVVD